MWTAKKEQTDICNTGYLQKESRQVNKAHHKKLKHYSTYVKSLEETQLYRKLRLTWTWAWELFGMKCLKTRL